MPSNKKEYAKKYYQDHKEKAKEVAREFYQEHKENINKRHKKYNQEHKGKIETYQKGYHKDYRKTHCRNEYNKKYKKDNKDKVKRYYAKRKRNLGWELLFDNPFPNTIPVEYHHISDAFVVAIPKNLHLNHYHGINTKKHRDELKPFIEKLYDVSYIII